MPKKIIGFSKLSREEKIDWLSEKIFDALTLAPGITTKMSPLLKSKIESVPFFTSIISTINDLRYFDLLSNDCIL